MRKYLVPSLLCVALLVGFGLYQAYGLLATEAAAPRTQTTDEVAQQAARQQCRVQPPHWRAMLMHSR